MRRLLEYQAASLGQALIPRTPQNLRCSLEQLEPWHIAGHWTERECCAQQCTCQQRRRRAHIVEEARSLSSVVADLKLAGLRLCGCFGGNQARSWANWSAEGEQWARTECRGGADECEEVGSDHYYNAKSREAFVQKGGEDAARRSVQNGKAQDRAILERA